MTTPDVEVLQARIRKLETRISNHTSLFIVLVVVAVFVAYLNQRPNKAMFVYNDAGDAVAWASVGMGSGPWIGLADPRGTVRAHLTAPVSGPFLALLGPEGLVTRDEDRQRLRGKVEDVIQKGSVSQSDLLDYVRRKLESLKAGKASKIS